MLAVSLYGRLPYSQKACINVTMSAEVPWFLRRHFNEVEVCLASSKRGDPLLSEDNLKHLIVDLHSAWAAEDWTKCLRLANALTDSMPEISVGWLYRSIAAREQGFPKKAIDLLLPIAHRFPDSWDIPFHISCFYSVLKEFKKAEEWLEKARDVNHEETMGNELCEPDLAGYWAWRRRMGLVHSYEFSPTDD